MTAALSPADLVLTGGAIHTMDERNAVARALAVSGGRIVFVGSQADAQAYIGSRTQVVDLQGGMALPGLMDCHIHAPGQALTELYAVQLDYTAPAEDNLDRLRRFLEEHPDADIVYGEGWGVNQYEGEERARGPRKERLDAVSADIPVVLTSYDWHTKWCNSAALARFGIADGTPQPAGGVIERDPATGALWGTLKESAMDLIPPAQYGAQQYEQALELFQRRMHGWGYTGMLAMGSPPVQRAMMDAYEHLHRAGRLTLRVHLAVTVDPGLPLEPQLDEMHALQRRGQRCGVEVSTAKFFADGVVEGATAFLDEPYTPAAGRGPAWRGEPLWQANALAQALRACFREGFSAHIHTIGDASTALVLDALEAAQAQRYAHLRPTLTHLQLVRPADIARMAALGVVACVQPYWHFRSDDWWEAVDHAFLGQRAWREYPLRSLFDAGIVVSCSSDHPITPLPNPLHAVELGATRRMRGQQPLGADEAVTVTRMLRAFTANAARQLRREGSAGTLREGMPADIVVLDRDITIQPADAVGSAQVRLTLSGGRVVYRQNA